MLFDSRLFDSRLFDTGSESLPSRMSIIYMSGKQDTDIDGTGKFDNEIAVTGAFFDQIEARGVSETEG